MADQGAHVLTPPARSLLAAFLDVRGKRCVVVGGGRVALRKVRALLAAGAEVAVVSPEAEPGLRELAEAGRVRWLRRPYRRGDLAGAWLAFAATGQEEVDRQVREEAGRRCVFVNPAAGGEAEAPGTFLLPAVRRRGRVTVAVGTGGGSPALAASLADRVAACVLPEHAALADLLAGLRGEARRLLPPEERQRFWRWAAADRVGLELLAAGRQADAAERLRAELRRRAAAGEQEGR